MTIHRGIDVPRSALAELCRRYGVRELALFGSALREDFGEHSDIDLVVEFQAGSSPDLVEFSAMRRELAELLGRRVDLVTKAGLKPLIRERVLAEAHVLYAA